MAAKNISFSVKAKDEATGTLKKVNGEMNKLSKEMKNTQFSRTTKSVKNLISSFSAYTAAITASIAVLKKYVSALNDMAEAANIQIRAETQLKTAVQNNPYLNGNSVKSLEEFASSIQSVTAYGDEQLIPFMAELASSGRTEAQIMKIMTAATDLAASGAMSLDSAVTALNNTYSGTTGTLGKFQSDIKELTTEQLKNGDAVDLIADKYKGMASAVAEASESKQMMLNAFGDLQEAFGNFTKPAVDSWNNMLKSMYESTTEWLNKIDHDMDVKLTGKAWYKQITSSGDTIDLNHSLEDLQLIEEYLKSKGKLNSIEQTDLILIQERISQLKQEAYWAEQDAIAVANESKAQEEAARTAEENAKKIQKWQDALKQFNKAPDIADYSDKDAFRNAMAVYDEEYQKAVATRNAKGADSASAQAYINAQWKAWGEEFDEYWIKALSSVDLSAVSGVGYTYTRDNPISLFGDLLRELYPETMQLADAVKSELIPGFDSVFASIGSAIVNIDAVDACLNWSQTILTGVMDVIEPLITEILEPLVGALTIFGNLIGQVLNPILEAFSLILEPLYNVIVAVLNSIQALIVGVSNAMIGVINAVITVINKVKSWFGGKQISTLAYQSFEAYSASDLTASGSSALSSYSSGSATYSGAKDVYITINYNNSYVNGDAREIALSLRDEIKAAEALGY